MRDVPPLKKNDAVASHAHRQNSTRSYPFAPGWGGMSPNAGGSHSVRQETEVK